MRFKLFNRKVKEDKVGLRINYVNKKIDGKVISVDCVMNYSTSTIPFCPDPLWLKDNGYDYVAFRKPCSVDVFLTKEGKLSICDIDTSVNVDTWGGKRFILKPSAVREETVPVEQVAAPSPEPIHPISSDEEKLTI